jgi:hypothetical protein
VLNDPVAAVVTAARPGNVDTVIIDGRFHQRFERRASGAPGGSSHGGAGCRYCSWTICSIARNSAEFRFAS